MSFHTLRCYIAFLTLVFVGCSKDDSGFFSGIYFDRSPRELRDGQGFYEMWLGFPKAGGGIEWESILRFDNVESTNKPFLDGKAAQLKLPERDISEASAAAVSIELQNDSDPLQPNRIFMSGNFINGIAFLELSGQYAFDMQLDDPTLISGKFVLATPSDSLDNNDASGVWFVDMPFGNGVQGAGLKLPSLPSGFHYEAWVATRTETVCISTGAFTQAAGNDINGAGPNGGGAAIPLFPGEDLVFDKWNADVQGRQLPLGIDTNAYKEAFKFPIAINHEIAINPITGEKDFWDIVVSIEPEPDNDPEEPFAIFPLVYFVRVTDPTNTVINMQNFNAGVAQLITINLEKLR
ncbi:hypothetical protein K1X84_14190 [bacterium]|nr:hypothetical protein [bacterium]